MVLASLLALCVQAGPQRWLLTVDAVPLAELRVEVKGRHYRYESTHFLEEGPAGRRLEFTLDEAGRVDGLMPEVLALARRPAPGCRTVLEEVERKPEELCVRMEDEAPGTSLHDGPQRDAGAHASDASKVARVTGSLSGRPFTARYDATGALASLELGAARWTASTTPATPPPPDANPFARGFALEGVTGQAALVPPLPGSARLGAPPRGGASASDVGRTRCLVAAKRYVTEHPGAVLVLGLVVEEGRAFPHAWVQDGGVAVDPSLPAGDRALTRRQYLALPAKDAGRVYLELLDGTRRVKLVSAREG
ncbi:MAG: hypothetical protein AB1938_27205 [Myxococcota bacterium]